MARAVKDGVFIASRPNHASKWKQMRSAGMPIVASWIDHIQDNGTFSPDSQTKESLMAAINEPREARGLILYCEEGDRIKGAMAQVGAALAGGKMVVQVGDCDYLRISETSAPIWLTKHPNWKIANTVEEAIEMIMKGVSADEVQDKVHGRARSEMGAAAGAAV